MTKFWTFFVRSINETKYRSYKIPSNKVKQSFAEWKQKLCWFRASASSKCYSARKFVVKIIIYISTSSHWHNLCWWSRRNTQIVLRIVRRYYQRIQNLFTSNRRKFLFLRDNPCKRIFLHSFSLHFELSLEYFIINVRNKNKMKNVLYIVLNSFEMNGAVYRYD